MTAAEDELGKCLNFQFSDVMSLEPVDKTLRPLRLNSHLWRAPEEDEDDQDGDNEEEEEEEDNAAQNEDGNLDMKKKGNTDTAAQRKKKNRGSMAPEDDDDNEERKKKGEKDSSKTDSAKKKAQQSERFLELKQQIVPLIEAINFKKMYRETNTSQLNSQLFEHKDIEVMFDEEVADEQWELYLEYLLLLYEGITKLRQ
jgi:hypothetical protein